MSNAGQIQDLTKAYLQYATDLTKGVLTQEGLGPFQAATIDGRLMGIPQVDSSIDKASLIWIRTDWLENLGLKPPKTMDDVIAIAKAFTEEDPDQNGLHDTYGLAATHYLWDPVAGLAGFMAGYDAYPQLWLEDEEGRLVYGGIQPEVKEALAALQDLYRQGILDPSFAIKKGEQVKQDIIDGKIGMMYGEQWGAFHVGGSRNTDSFADWKAFPIVSAYDHPPMVPLKFTISSFFAVRSDYEHPEAVVKLFNLHLEKIGAKPLSMSVTTMIRALLAVFSGYSLPAQEESQCLPGDRSLQEGRAAGICDAGSASDLGLYAVLPGGRRCRGLGMGEDLWTSGAYAIIDAYDKNGQLLYDRFTGVPTPTMIDRISSCTICRTRCISTSSLEIRSKNSTASSSNG